MAELNVTRELPTSFEAEMATLGSVFIAPRMLPEIRAVLRTDDFMLPVHREIFEAMAACDRGDRPVDVIMVADELKARGTLSRLEGGEGYLLKLANAVPTAESAVYYAGVVAEKSQARRLIAACVETVSRAYGAGSSVQELLDDHAGLIMRIATRQDTDLRTIRDTVDALPAIFDSRTEKVTTGVSLCLRELDRYTGGIQRSQYAVVAARPGGGKTAYAMQVGRKHCLLRPGVNKTLFISLEQSEAEIVERLYCMDAPADSDKIKRNLLDKPAWDRLHDSQHRLRDMGFYVVEQCATMRQIESVAQRFVSRHPDEGGDGTPPSNLLVVDYIQLINTMAARGELATEATGRVSHELKRLLRRLRLPGIIVSQLNRASEKENREPRMSDLRQAGDIEQDADIIIFPHNPSKRPWGEVQLFLAKNKNGMTGAIDALWKARHYTFDEIPIGGHTEQPTEIER